MYYDLIKPILFRLDPETAHTLALNSLQIAHTLRLTRLITPVSTAPREVMGLQFKNPIGLAAGLDKNGDYIDALATLGFGWIEVGTVTPKPQAGNPKPRLFRLPKHQALINRLGFNNNGVNYLVDRLKRMNYHGVLGVNIGKNRDTPLENAVDDYLHVFRCVARYASYVTINISSPNTESLRDLQQSAWLRPLLRALKEEQALIFELHKKYIPLVVKIAPDLTQAELEAMAVVLLTEKVDGVIATNTTLSRDSIADSPLANESGGLSGKPLKSRATEIVKQLNTLLQAKIPIIACGGITDNDDVMNNLNAGASLVQCYTGLIYRGPSLVHRLLTALIK